jgi:serine/threonine protein kinase/tetratricopeptide (TPR) repeat protein
MNGSDHQRVKELLSQAARQPPPGRRGFIEQHAETPQIAAEAIDLLSTLDDSAFLSAVTGAGMAAALDVETSMLEGPGKQIGRYKLLQRIGEGGFGTVFMAEQTEPVVRRVALKIIKPGMDTRAVIARFEAERQALAMMEHPNIARVLDAGATELGRPYFVMELVRGDPVTHYCDQQQLSIEDRLTLFQDICGAVQHAHQKGIIHRDIKPSNVLVTVADGRPLPKVIDFGIAKATAIRLTDKTLFTEMHQLIGTPEYMSPEQAEISGVDIDTRSDIYSLGVLLYELLAGSPPFDGRRLRSASFAEIQRIIRDEEPPRPSLRLRSLAASSSVVLMPANSSLEKPSTDASAIEIAKRRRTEPMALTRSLRGDLDWIVMKCLEKDRARRYGTASALAGDISAYLTHEPVSATPPSSRYKLRKFIQRRRGVVLAAAAIAATLIIATFISITFAVRASRALAAGELQSRRADNNAKETEQIARYQSDLISGIDVRGMGRGLKELFRQQVQSKLAGQYVGEWPDRRQRSPQEVVSELEAYDRTVADVQPADVARRVLAQYFLDNGIDALKKKFAAQPRVQAELLHTFGMMYFALGLNDKAEPTLRRALELREADKDSDKVRTADTMAELAGVLSSTGRRSEAGELHRRTLLIYTTQLGKQHFKTITAMNNIGVTLAGLGKYDAAEQMLRDGVTLARHLPNDQQQLLATTLSHLGAVHQAKGEIEKAEPLLREALTLRRALLGSEHPDVAETLSELGGIYCNRADFVGAERLFRESLEIKRKVFGDDSAEFANDLNNLAWVRESQGDRPAARKLNEDALAIFRRNLGDEHPKVAATLNQIASLLQRDGEYSAAEPMFRESLELQRRSLGVDHPDVALSLANLAVVLRKKGDPAGAEVLFREALAIYENKVPHKHPWRLAAQLGFTLTLLAETKTEEAESILDEIAKLWQSDDLPDRYKKVFNEAHVQLCEAKDRLTPNQGFDRKAAEWRQKLEPTSTTTQPQR